MRRYVAFAMITGLLLGAAAVLSASAQDAEDAVLRLPLGPAAHRAKTLTVRPGVFLSAAKGKAVVFEKMAGALKKSRLVYVGETHDSLPMHDVQADVIEALAAAVPKLSIGLEMLPVDFQPVLDRWSRGELSEDELIRDSRWYLTWSFNFGYYRRIFLLAKERGIQVFALNSRRENVATVRMKGWDALSEEDRAVFPRPGLDNQDHRSLIRAIFESTEIPPQMKGAGLDVMFEALYRAQSFWDEVMAAFAVRRAEESGTSMVVLAGSGHLLYNLGINRRAFEKTRWPSATVVCVAVPKGAASVVVARGLADFVVGIPAEERPAFPAVGLAFKSFEGLRNLVVEKKPSDGVAKAADFEKGDIVLSVDGKSFDDANALRTYLAGFGWGEESRFRILRAGAEKEVALKFEAPAE